MKQQQQILAETTKVKSKLRKSTRKKRVPAKLMTASESEEERDIAIALELLPHGWVYTAEPEPPRSTSPDANGITKPTKDKSGISGDWQMWRFRYVQFMRDEPEAVRAEVNRSLTDFTQGMGPKKVANLFNEMKRSQKKEQKEIEALKEKKREEKKLRKEQKPKPDQDGGSKDKEGGAGKSEDKQDGEEEEEND